MQLIFHGARRKKQSENKFTCQLDKKILHIPQDKFKIQKQAIGIIMF